MLRTNKIQNIFHCQTRLRALFTPSVDTGDYMVKLEGKNVSTTDMNSTLITFTMCCCHDATYLTCAETILHNSHMSVYIILYLSYPFISIDISHCPPTASSILMTYGRKHRETRPLNRNMLRLSPDSRRNRRWVLRWASKVLSLQFRIPCSIYRPAIEKWESFRMP